MSELRRSDIRNCVDNTNPSPMLTTDAPSYFWAWIRNVRIKDIRARYATLLLCANLLCVLFTGCSGSNWQEVTPHYTSTNPPARLQFSQIPVALIQVWGLADGAQLWAVGTGGTILRYSKDRGKWETQASGTSNVLQSIYGTGDGAQLWAVGNGGTILHYSKDAGKWETQTSGTTNVLGSIYGTSDGAELWAVGSSGTILRYSRDVGKWEMQVSGTTNLLTSIYGTGDGAQLWAVGNDGTILHYSKDSGKWETQASGTSNVLQSIYGTGDGAQLWAVGDGGTILHYSKDAGKWETQSSGTSNVLKSIYGTGDGAQLWAVGNGGTILHYSKDAGKWETQTSGTTNVLESIYGTSDGAQAWAVGWGNVVLHYSKDAGKWETQASGTWFSSLYETGDGAQAWAVGNGGTILHYSKDAGKWETQASGTTNNLLSVYGTNDGAQAWAVGNGGIVLRYSKDTGKWETQISGPNDFLHSLNSIYGTSDGAQLWAVGTGGTIRHYSKDAGKWETQASGTTNNLLSIYASSDGGQVWAVGFDDIILHYSKDAGKWETQSGGTNINLLNFSSLNSIHGSSDGAQVWTVGSGGKILHYSKDAGKWETQASGTTNNLVSIYGTSDGAQAWAVGNAGTILYYSKDVGKWETGSGTTNTLQSIYGTRDGAELWAAGPNNTIMRAESKRFNLYVSEVRLLPKLRGGELQVRIAQDANSTKLPLELSLYGSNKHNYKANFNPEKINAVARQPRVAGDAWVFDFDPADIGVAPGDVAYLQIDLKQGGDTWTYNALVEYDPYHLIREHWLLSLLLFLVGSLVAVLTALLFTRPLWNLYLYRKLKIYTVVEQIDIPGVGKILQLILKLTILPRFVTHRRTLHAWVAANRAAAGNAWDANFRLSSADINEQKRLDVPYVPLPLLIEDSGPKRSLPQPTPEHFDSLLKSKRSVVQIIGQGGGGKTTLARHIGNLALAGGEPGGLKHCRLPVWVDEDTTDLWEVIKRKIESWQAEGDPLEDEFLKALIENGLLLIIFDRVSERSTATQDYLGKVHGKLRCNALILTARHTIAMEVAEQRFVYPQSLDSATLLNFMTAVIQYCVPSGGIGENRPFATIQSQLELGKRLADLIAVRIGPGDRVREVPILPLPVILFVSSAVDLITNGRGLDEVPRSLPNIYTDYLRRINPKTFGVANAMSDEDMLAVAKALAKIAVGTNYIPKEFTREQATECIRATVHALPQQIDALQRLAGNGVLMFKWVGATGVYRFALDPVAEFLAAEAYFDGCESNPSCLENLLQGTNHAQGFHNALLLTIQARDATFRS